MAADDAGRAAFERDKLDYEQVVSIFSLLTDVRFKLLALVPTVSGTASALLAASGLPDGARTALAAVGFVVTLGIVVYEQRNTQLYNNVVGRAARLEQSLELARYEQDRAGGLFASRATRARRLFGVLPMRHDRGIGVIYAASLGAWAFAGVQPFASLGVACAAGGVVALGFALEFERLDRRQKKGGAVMAGRTQIPARYLDTDGADFAEPTSSLLVALGLLGEENAYKPDALNELQEGALKFSKWIGGLAGGAGVAGIATSIASAFTHAHEPTRVALISGGCLIAAAAVVAVALVVQADARARAQSTAAQYAARAEVGAAFLALADELLRPSDGDRANGRSRRRALSRQPEELIAQR